MRQLIKRLLFRASSVSEAPDPGVPANALTVMRDGVLHYVVNADGKFVIKA